MSTKPYRRILLKLSGEMLMGKIPFGIESDACLTLAKSIQAFQLAGYEIGIVIGGGNLFRGIDLTNDGLSRTPADQMGMLATIMNGIAIEQTLQNIGCPAKALSAIECPRIVETYTWRSAMEYLSTGTVLIFVAGTGNPYFTTDTAAAMRASEIKADILLKATKVDGIYSKDPLKYPDATKYKTLSYSQMLAEKLEVMDATSIALCRKNHIPIQVFQMELLKKIHPADILSLQEGTLVSGD